MSTFAIRVTAAVLLVLCIILTAGVAINSVLRQPARQKNTVGTTFPMTVEDHLHRQVTLPTAPQRIVSLMPSHTEMLYAVGAGPHVVAGTKNDNYPEAAATLPSVAEFAINGQNLELIVSLKPDLVLASGAWQRAVIDALEGLGIAVVALDPKSLAEVQASIELVGRITDCAEQGQQAGGEFQRRWQAVAERTAHLNEPNKPKVIFLLSSDPVMLGGAKSFLGEMMSVAGAVHVFPELDLEYPKVSDEEILKRGVDVILCPNHANESVLEQLARRPGWNGLAAVRKGNVVKLPDDLVTRPGPRLVQGLEAMELAIRAATDGK